MAPDYPAPVGNLSAKAVAPFIFNELCRVPHLVYNRGLEKFRRLLAKAQFGNANLLEISKHHSSLTFSCALTAFIEFFD